MFLRWTLARKSESAVERFDLDSEGLARVMLGVWNEILVGPQQVSAVAYRWQKLDLLQKDLTCFDRPSSKDKAEDLRKDGVHRKPEPTLRFF